LKGSIASLFVFTILFVSIFSSLLFIPAPANATIGTISLSAGETKYLNFDYAGISNLLLWSFAVISQTTSLVTFWLEAPNGTHYVLPWVAWGKITDATGIWRWAFYISPADPGSATLGYDMRVIVPELHISTPIQGSYLNTTDVTVEGTVGMAASNVSISSDDVHYYLTDKYLTSWMGDISLTEGIHTITAEVTYDWGAYWAKFYKSVDITIDLTAPTFSNLNLTGKKSGTNIFTEDNVIVSWSGQDLLSGVDHYRVRLDNGDWTLITNSMPNKLTYRSLGDGGHIVTFEATDRAGNTVTTNSTFTVDKYPFSITGPYSGIPLFIIIAAIVGAFLLTPILLFRRSRRIERSRIQANQFMQQQYQAIAQQPIIPSQINYTPQPYQPTAPLPTSQTPIAPVQPASDQTLPSVAVSQPQQTFEPVAYPPAPAPQSIPQVSNQPNTIPATGFCSACGKPAEGGLFCAYCGARLK